MDPITGTVSITLESAKIMPAGPPYTYLGVAENLMPGVKVLAAATPVPGLALPFVCAHVLECVLKAYLSRYVPEKALRDRKLCHNLNALWILASAQGLRVDASPPAWVDCLSGLHNGPKFFLRYSTRVHGVVSPAAEPMATELGALLEVVREQLR
jgi:hypothetical protein